MRYVVFAYGPRPRELGEEKPGQWVSVSGAKGVIGIERQGKANCYFPTMAREACLKAVSASFFERMLGGAIAPTLAHFCETAPLSPDEIRGLEAILRERQKKGKRDE